MQQNSCGSHSEDHCHPKKGSRDYILWGSLSVIILAFCLKGIRARQRVWGEGLDPSSGSSEPIEPGMMAVVDSGVDTIVDLMLKMGWGLAFAVAFVGIMDYIPRTKFHQLLGKKDGASGILRATLAGVILDLCSHGILLVAMKLYERGASLGQVVAFLVASPWNSFSMTLILWSLIGLKLTIVFIVASCVIAVISGLIFDRLVQKEKLPKNPHREIEIDWSEKRWIVLPEGLRGFKLVKHTVMNSLHESQMILRWIFFGVVFTAVIKELLSPEHFQHYFGPDTIGILFTVAAATVIEVCSEGNAPLASELVTTAKAPGNGFTFLMAGVSTDYTEIMSIKETTKSWKTALFLPLITVPQIIIIGIILNKVSF